MTSVFRHDHLLGTVIELRVETESESLAAAVNDRVVATCERLEAVFSVYDDRSELHRWLRGELSEPSPEFCTVMAAALDWMVRSGGSFNPLAGELTARWQQAETSNSLPDPGDLAAAAAAIAEPRFELVGGVPVASGDCSRLNLNAIAKGYIVDRALDCAGELGVESLVVNAGGDLAHRGAGLVRAGIENPHRPYDNEPPLAVIGLSNRALATSGSARRGFRVGDRWFGHVINPHTGWPVDEIASISVVAPDAMTADVLATVAGVRPPKDALAYLADAGDVEGLVIDAQRCVLATSGWADLVVS